MWIIQNYFNQICCWTVRLTLPLSILNNSMVNILENMDIHVNYHGDLFYFSLNFVKVEIELKHRKVSIPVSIHSRDIHQ